MRSVRRWYIYLVSAISLQAVAWVVIALVRDLLLRGIDYSVSTTALQVAVILVGLPVFLGHWLWSQRLARRSEEERTALLRTVYLYGMMAGFLGPFLFSTAELVAALLGDDVYIGYGFGTTTTAGDVFLYELPALLLLTLLWFYHWREVGRNHPAGMTGRLAVVRRLYVYGVTAVGLVLTTQGVVELIQWLGTRLSRTLPTGGIIGGDTVPIFALQSLIVGLPLWLIAWRRAETLFAAGDEESASALRKFYLYLAVFVGVIFVVTGATIILAANLERALGVPRPGDVWMPLSQIIGLGLVWLYHAMVLRRDQAAVTEAPRQAAIGRLYRYLVAGVGLAVLLVGVGGVISVLLRALDSSFSSDLRSETAWFISAIVAGLPVWLLPWRQIVRRVAAEQEVTAGERQSLIRRIYLYFYLFVAAMVLLASLVYIVSRVVQTVLGMAPPTLAQLGQAIAYGLLAVGVWLLHFWLLRGDGRLAEAREAARLAAARVAVVGATDSPFRGALLAQLAARLPTLPVTPVDLPAAGAEGGWGGDLAAATLIVAPSGALLPNGGPALAARTIGASPARKLVVPEPAPQWRWAGGVETKQEALVESTVAAIERLAMGEEEETGRSPGVGAVIAIVIGLLIALFSLLTALINLFT